SPARRWRRFRAMSDRDERDVSVVGRGAHVEGSLVSPGSLWIAGRMTGEISVEGQVTVAPDSEVEADIKAGSINLAGRVNGNLTAPGSVELPAQSQVKGDVRARSVSVQGAVEGNVVAEQKVELGPDARLQGDITCTALGVAEQFGRIDLSTRQVEWLPAADVLSRGDDMVIRLELPGIEPSKDLEITVEDDVLHIRGERRESEEETRDGFIRRETSYGSFERSLPLLRQAKTDDLKATYQHGILEIVVPTGAKQSAQRVPVPVTRGKKK